MQTMQTLLLGALGACCEHPQWSPVTKPLEALPILHLKSSEIALFIYRIEFRCLEQKKQGC